MPQWTVGESKYTAYLHCADAVFSSPAPPAGISSYFERAFLEQGRFLACLWFLCGFEAYCAAMLVSRYGDLRSGSLTRQFCDKFLLRQISEWYVLFSRMALSAKDDRTQVVVDVLTSQSVLYRGELVDWFLDSDGKLAGIFLGSAERFNRDDLKEDRKNGTMLPADWYWRQIPGAKLYLTAASIVNYNVRYVRPVTATEQDAVVRELDLGQTATITPLVD